MFDKEPSLLWWLETAAYAVFAAFGGGAGYIMRQLHAKRKIGWWRAVVEALAAGFSGVLVMLLCNAMHFSDAWTGVIVGVCGWLGADATIRMLERVVARKIGAGEERHVSDVNGSGAQYERYEKQDPPVG